MPQPLEDSVNRFVELQVATSAPKRMWISAFIILNVVAIFFSSIPSGYPLSRWLSRLAGPYISLSGLWQSWNMFAPDPDRVNIRLDATVTLRDGALHTWVFPEMQDLGLLERYRKERYRKWAQDKVRLDAQSATWSPTARYIARQFDSTGNPPVRVDLHRHWTEIPLPEGRTEMNEATWSHFTFYRTQFEQDDE